MRVTKRIAVVGSVGFAFLLGAGYVVADRWFLPEEALRVDEDLPASAGGGAMDVLATGTFSGRTGHHVSGTVKVLAAYAGVAIWCDNFNVLFGSAPLDPPAS